MDSPPKQKETGTLWAAMCFPHEMVVFADVQTGYFKANQLTQHQSAPPQPEKRKKKKEEKKEEEKSFARGFVSGLVQASLLRLSAESSHDAPGHRNPLG